MLIHVYITQLMSDFNREILKPPTHLVTDLDGTYLPLPGHPEHHQALQQLQAAREDHGYGLVFCTGRHFESVCEVMKELSLAPPDWIICDVGTSIHHREAGTFQPFLPYAHHLAEKVGSQNREAVETLLKPVEHLNLQCESHQGRFKISYECDPAHTDSLVATVATRLKEHRLPYEVHGSLDPFLNCGLIDVLPQGVSKAYAVTWLATHADFDPGAVLFAGDSGNDLPALTAGFRAILVAYHSEGLDRKVEETLGTRASSLLYKAEGHATSAVLEGCRHFGLIP